jgi:predicted dinucleotide-binding enzyme
MANTGMTTVGIIGSGMIGGTVAGLAVATGYHVVVSNSRGPQTLAELAAELGPLARPHGAEDRSALPIAGDDPAAKQAVAEFLDAIGYDAVDAGSLADSWRQEPGTPVYGTPTARSPTRSAPPPPPPGSTPT